MKTLITSLALILFCQTATANSIRVQQNMYRIDTKAVLTNSSLTDAEKAEELALSAEQLVQMSGMMYAGELLDMALELDASNRRANFWKEYVLTNETFRGWYSRFRKLIAERPADETYDFYRNLEEAKKHPAFYEFITEDRPVLKNEADVQGFVDTHIAALDRFRNYLKSAKNNSLRVIIYQTRVSQQATDKWGRRCHISRTSVRIAAKDVYPVYHISNCEVKGTKVAQLDRSDFEALQHMVAGNQLLFAVMNAYKLDGAIASKDASENKSNKERFETFFKDESFGVIRSESFLKMVHSLGVDALAGYKRFVEQRDELCPNGIETPDQRSGKLFEKGICVIRGEDNYTTITRLVEKSLNGEVIKMAVSEKDHWPTYPGVYTETRLKPVELLGQNEEVLYETDMILASPLLNPIQDLRSVAPTKWNKCDRVEEIASADAGGALPYRDSADVLKALDKDCQ